MKDSLLFFFAFIVFISCDGKSQKEAYQETFIDFKPKENIASFKISEIVNGEYSDNCPDSLFAKNFDPKTDTIVYNEREIYISYLAGLTGCVKYEGDIEIKNDSLILKLVPINNLACTELNIGRVIFRIKNPENLTYKIAKSLE